MLRVCGIPYRIPSSIRPVTNVFAVYVPTDRGENLAIGLGNLVWGWRDEVLARSNRRAVALSMAPGDLLLLGTRGPNPRVDPGAWATQRLGYVAVTRVVARLRTETNPVWPDDVYPQRLDLELVAEMQNAGALELGVQALESMRLSANTQGAPVPVGSTSVMPANTMPGPGSEDDGDLGHEGSYDAYTLALVRREQKKLRARKFGRSALLTCDLCGRTLPRRLVRAAHIKRRSKCTFAELGDLANVMAACTLGCDELFEHGYVVIGPDHSIIARDGLTGDIRSAAHDLHGRRATAPASHALRYAEWHRTFHSVQR